MAVQKFGVSLRPDTMTEIDRRIGMEGERSTIINRQLERYFNLLDRARRELRSMLSDNEMALILDTLNGVAFFDTFGLYHIAMEVEDAISMDHLDAKWEVDGKALLNKLKAMNDAQLVALVDATQIWWNRVGHGEQPEYGEALK